MLAFTLMVVCLTLSCTERDSVVLLQPGGQLEVTTNKATVRLQKPLQGIEVDKTGDVRSMQRHPEEIAATFGEMALDAQRSAHFTLYFLYGTQLTNLSEQEVQAIVVALRNAAIKEIHLVGYTDRVGSAHSNKRLALRRAEHIRQRLFSTEKLLPLHVRGALAHEVKPALDENSYEPRERRVEVLIQFQGGASTRP